MIKLMLSKILLITLLVISGFGIEIREEINKQAWIDFPNEHLSFHLGIQNSLFQQADMLIDVYHKIDKSDLSLLKNRIVLLEQISTELELISSQIQEIRKTKILHSLEIIAEKKTWYLKQLEKIHKNNFDNETILSNFFVNSTIQSKNHEALCLINQVSYDTNLPAYWGLYLLEIVDPCHRLHLTSYFLKWKKINTTIPFFIWLEDQEVPYYSPQIKIFDQDDLYNFTYEISKNDHLLYNAKAKLADLDNENIEYLYIITLEKKILIVEGSPEIRHSSLSKGDSVLGVGTIKVKSGKIVYCDVESGHYQPSLQHMQQVIEIFSSLGAILSENLEIKYYGDQGKVKTTLKNLPRICANNSISVEDKF